jgi:hypothetical protein
MLTLAVKPQWVRYKLDETIGLVLISWPYTKGSVYLAKWRFSSRRRVTKSLSWGMCTTSTECKTVITAVLTVMSGMDPHMIS